MTVPEMFASGLQSERTDLAWRRTAVGLLVGSVVGWRLLVPAIGWWALALGIAGVVVAGVVWVLAGRRGQQATRALIDGQPLDGAGLLLFLAGSVAVAAAIGIWFVVR